MSMQSSMSIQEKSEEKYRRVSFSIPINDTVKAELMSTVQKLNKKYTTVDFSKINYEIRVFEKELMKRCADFSIDCLFRLLLPYESKLENLRFVFA